MNGTGDKHNIDDLGLEMLAWKQPNLLAVLSVPSSVQEPPPCLPRICQDGIPGTCCDTLF